MVSERLVSRTTVLWDMGRTTKTLAASVSRGAQIGRFLRMQPLPLPAPKSGLGPVSPPQPELRTRLFHSERLFKAPLSVPTGDTDSSLSGQQGTLHVSVTFRPSTAFCDFSPLPPVL